MTADQIKEFIYRRRSQMLVHSCIYYQMDENVISDDQWQKWANELANVQDEFPQFHKLGFFDREFVGWDGTSGAFLPLKNDWVWNKALHVLEMHQRSGNQVSEESVPARKPTRKEMFNELFE